MREWLIRLLGGATSAEVEFLRMQLRDKGSLSEAILELRSLIMPSQTPQPTIPVKASDSPIKTVSEPWTVRKRRLELEDLKRLRDEKEVKSTDYEVGRERYASSRSPSEGPIRQKPVQESQVR
jgi:hypothetical protein